MVTLVSGGTLPVGSILPFGGPSTEVPDGFLLCDGSEINRNDFADLFAVIGTYWGSGNGSTTFRIPTTQGLQLRGVAYGSGNDPDRNSRTAVATGAQTGDEVGSFQNHRYQSHSHRTWFSRRNANNPSGVVIGGGANAPTNANKYYFDTYINGGVKGYNGNYGSNSWGNSIYIYTTNVGSSQTVGVNVYVNYIIKY